MDIIAKKIVTVSQLARLAKAYQKAGKIVGCMSGSFDVMTGKHFKCFYEYSRHCDVLLVLLNSNTSVALYKGSERPIVHEAERAFIVAQSPYVSHVAIFDEVVTLEALEKIRPDIFFNSAEWGPECIEKSVVEKYGGVIKSFDITFPDTWFSSSSEMVKKIVAIDSIKSNKAVFLDRDGVINENGAGYVHRWEDFEFLTYVLSSLKKFQKAGFKLFIVTNQSGVGRGYYTIADVEKLHHRITKYFKDNGVVITGIYYCPHSPDEGCSCRKPAPGMLFQAARDYNINLSKSWFIGDTGSDIDAGRFANTRTVRILHKGDNINDGQFAANVEVKDIKEATNFILK